MRIAEVSNACDISADTLRYYERIGLLPHIARTPSGIREYTEEDCARIRFVKCMRAANVSIDALIEYMRLFDEGDATSARRKEILVQQRDLLRERIADMQAGLDRLTYKIDHYDDVITPSEESLRDARA